MFSNQAKSSTTLTPGNKNSASLTNASKNSASFANTSKTVAGGGVPYGLLLALTRPAHGATYSLTSKGSAIYSLVTKS